MKTTVKKSRSRLCLLHIYRFFYFKKISWLYWSVLCMSACAYVIYVFAWVYVCLYVCWFSCMRTFIYTYVNTNAREQKRT